MAEVNIRHVCDDCGNDKAEIDTEKSNENWTVYSTICSSCGG